MKPGFVCIFAVLLSAFSGQTSSRSVRSRTRLVAADGKFETAPDTALIQFNISTQAENAKEAYDQAAKQAEATRQILRANGIEPKTAEIGIFP